MSACKGSPAKHESLLEILANGACGRGAGTGKGLLLAFFSSAAKGVCVRVHMRAPGHFKGGDFQTFVSPSPQIIQSGMHMGKVACEFSCDIP